MATTSNGQPTIVRTDRGLTIAGTRLTLYAVMEHIKAGWPAHLIQGWLSLTEAQYTAAAEYIDKHRAEVEQEYLLVEQQNSESRDYWNAQQRNRMPAPPSHPDLHARLAQWKAHLGQS